MSMNFGDFSSLPLEQQEVILNGPALAPPPSVVPNLDDPPNGNALFYVVLSIFLVLITVPLAGRVGIRLASRQLFIGDFLLIFAYALVVVNFVLCYRLTITPGAFVHQWNVSLRLLIDYLHITFIMSSISLVIIAVVKVVILLEWIRIFVPKGTRNMVFWTSHALIWVNVVFSAIMIVMVNIACEPYEYSWNKLISGNCNRVNTASSLLTSAVFSLVTDVLIFLIPQRVIWSLNMAKEKKYGVALTFAVGFLGIGAGGARVALAVVRKNSKDFSYNFSGVVLATAAEMTAAFLVICIPAIPKAFNATTFSKIAGSLRSWGSRSNLRSAENSDSGRSGRSWEHSKENGSEVDATVHKHREGSTEELFNARQVDAEVGILRTTQFAIKEGHDPNASKSENARRHGLNGLQ